MGMQIPSLGAHLRLNMSLNNKVLSDLYSQERGAVEVNLIYNWCFDVCIQSHAIGLYAHVLVEVVWLAK